jgi:hypothetical protein
MIFVILINKIFAYPITTLIFTDLIQYSYHLLSNPWWYGPIADPVHIRNLIDNMNFST